MLEVHRDGFDLRRGVVLEELAVPVPLPVARVWDDSTPVTTRGLAHKTRRVGNQDVECESRPSIEVMAYGAKAPFDVLPCVEVIPDVEGGDHERESTSKP